MLGKRKIFFIIFLISLILSLYPLAIFASEIEIKPVLEGESYYIIQLGQTQTFQACGFGWDKDKQEKIPGIEIKSIQWSFDARFLELLEKKADTITLKAIKARTSKLTVTGIVENKTVTRDIFIVIK